MHTPNIYVHYRCYISDMLHKSTPGQLANGQHKCHMKRGLEFKKNAVSSTTFAGQPTMSVVDIVCSIFIIELYNFVFIIKRCL